MELKCEMCGARKSAEDMIRRKLNSRSYYCCGIDCEVRWEKLNLVGICG